MTDQISLDLPRTAVLSMDLQIPITDIYLKEDGEFLERTAQLMKSARDRQIRIIHAKIGFRAGVPEVGSDNPLYGTVKSFVEQHDMSIHPEVGPVGEEVVIAKPRTSAFTGTALDMILRAQGIKTLVLFGISTSGVVLSTLLQASDADYQTIVIKDCCADLDAEVHNCLIDKVFPQTPMATVLSAAEFVDLLK